MTFRECGQIGGNMVKKMVTFAEKELVEKQQGSDIIDYNHMLILNSKRGTQVKLLSLSCVRLGTQGLAGTDYINCNE